MVWREEPAPEEFVLYYLKSGGASGLTWAKKY